MTPTPLADTITACRCGHDRDLHEHDRPGSDCGVGGPDHCSSFRHATPLLQRLLSRVLHPAPADHGGAPLASVHTLAAARSTRTASARVVASTGPRATTATLHR